jgi:hypothetical protein
MYLVMAYHGTQNWQAAFDLAQRLSRCEDDKVRAWAFEVLPSLSEKVGIEESTRQSTGPRLEIYVSSLSSQPVRLPRINSSQPPQASMQMPSDSMINRVLGPLQSVLGQRSAPCPELAHSALFS